MRSGTTNEVRTSHALRRLLLLALPLVLPACSHDWDDPYWEAKVAACDRAVSSLLATRDAVELERSKFLVRHLDCGIERRLVRVSG